MGDVDADDVGSVQVAMARVRVTCLARCTERFLLCLRVRGQL